MRFPRSLLRPLAAGLFTLASVSPARAAESSALSAKAGEPDEREKQFLIRPFFALDELSLELSRGDETVSFVPNSQLAVGLRVGYAGFTVSASVDVDTSEDPTVYGKSQYLALQLGRAFRVADRELFVTAFLQFHEGLYVDEGSGLPSGAPPIVLPEMSVFSLGATGTYYLNPEFSYDATFIEFLPRSTSIGSWTLRMSTGLMGFENDEGPILPEPVRAGFGEVGTLSESAAAYVGAMGGYSLDLRLGRWFLAGSLLIGATAAREGHRLDSGVERGGTLGPSALLVLALGYAGDTFHGGLATSADLESTTVGPAEAQIIRAALGLFLGVRF